MLVIEGPWDLTPNAERRSGFRVQYSAFYVRRSMFLLQPRAWLQRTGLLEAHDYDYEHEHEYDSQVEVNRTRG